MVKNTQPPVVSIVGHSGSGKTTLIEKLIPELRRRGYRVGTIKHHVHEGFEIDYPDKDSWRHAQAGSEYVVIASPGKMAIIQRLEKEPSLDDIVARVREVDIILTEGYHWENKPKIEVIRATHRLDPLNRSEDMIAIATDIEHDFGVPCFGLEEVGGIVDLIEQELMS